MGIIQIEIPESILQKAKELAAQDNVSINQFITLALAEKISAMTTEQYLKERAKRVTRADFDAALSKVADVEPDEQDHV